ncbi:unnamed protein product [Brassica oleracea]
MKSKRILLWFQSSSVIGDKYLQLISGEIRRSCRFCWSSSHQQRETETITDCNVLLYSFSPLLPRFIIQCTSFSSNP